MPCAFTRSLNIVEVISCFDGWGVFPRELVFTINGDGIQTKSFVRITGVLDFPSSDILETRKQTFRKLDLFPSSGEWGRHILNWVP
jgi:hypothetical protein